MTRCEMTIGGPLSGVLLVAVAAVIAGNDAPAPADRETPVRVEQLIRELVDADFAIRTQAEHQLAVAQVAHVEALEAAATRDSEHAARIVSLLERLFVGEAAANAESLRLARVACMSSADIPLTLRRFGDVETTPVMRSAEDALDRLSQTNSPASSYAEEALSRHAVLRESRAIADIRASGGRIVFELASDPLHLAIEELVADPNEPADEHEIQPIQPTMISQVFVLPNWKNGVVGLADLRRVRTFRGLPVYLIAGCGLTSKEALSTLGDVPGLVFEERSAATLGVSASPWETGRCEVAAVTPGLAADLAGIRERDVIRKINDTGIASFRELVNELTKFAPGDEVSLTVRSEGRLDDRALTVRLSDWSQFPDLSVHR